MRNTMSLPVSLTDAEIAVRSKELTDVLREKKLAEFDLKSTQRAIKDKIAGLDGDISRLAEIVRSGKENRDVDVQDVPDYEKGLMNTIRLDTGEVAAYRPLKESERTKSLFDRDENLQTESETTNGAVNCEPDDDTVVTFSSGDRSVTLTAAQFDNAANDFGSVQ